jgi:serine/threonine-protein kinase SRPK3
MNDLLSKKDLAEAIARESVVQNVQNQKGKKNLKRKLKKRMKRNQKRQGRESQEQFEVSVKGEDHKAEPREGEGNPRLTKHFVVKIADLGNGCWIHHHFQPEIQTRQYRSPEVILGLQYNERTDMWSFACMLFEMLTGDFLFDPRK